MTTPTLDEQVEKLMELVYDYAEATKRDYFKSQEIYRLEIKAFARAALERPAVPEGWQLVPVELTPEMVAAWASACAGPPEQGKSYSAEETKNIVAAADWKAMLNAAPPAPKETP